MDKTSYVYVNTFVRLRRDSRCKRCTIKKTLNKTIFLFWQAFLYPYQHEKSLFSRSLSLFSRSFTFFHALLLFFTLFLNRVRRTRPNIFEIFKTFQIFKIFKFKYLKYLNYLKYIKHLKSLNLNSQPRNDQFPNFFSF